MNLIVAVDKNWAIGKNNQLLVRIPLDQKFFRETTTGKVVVMGRKTLESFPNGLPLKNRVNIVLTHNPDYKVKDAIVVHSMDELHEELKKYKSEDIYVIGGQKIYEQLVDECDVAHVTKINYAYDADAFFPNLDEKPEWEITADSEEQTYFDLEFYFYTYVSGWKCNFCKPTIIVCYGCCNWNGKARKGSSCVIFCNSFSYNAHYHKSIASNCR